MDESTSRIQSLRKVPLPSLRVFEAAGRTCSFALAADELDLSPSAVSHSIRKLEEMVALRLFERSTREVRLTREGETLLEHVQRGLEEMRRGFALVTADEPAPLRLHTAPTFATQWLLPRLARFVRDHPQIDLRISASTEYARFENDDFDFDIVYGEPKPSPYEKVPLAMEKLTPLCTPEIAQQIQTAEDLYQQTLIQCDLQMFQWKGWFEANRLLPPHHYGLRFDRSSMAISAAADGLGVVLESTLLAERELAKGHLVCPLRGKTQDVQYVGHHLVYPRRIRQHDSFEVFKHWLLAELAQPSG
ncbi:LysR substrate-binding domain-containing protein [Cupriavidus taiwanensis]|uniref:DNA-binding transcriptional regulator involved in oxidative stress resistance CP4-6 prophage n=1 Tax=Cupriavidus taiwanensis TaxID=164546 RepID=A0A975X7D0_9BURK|nr:LysR substrate-binding domain-containing protein [Cupriavidus taiwanensis]MDK3025897.1 LysR substrate-binding domain-containing protein [Cupriavidus taiwanensis]SOY61068.1 DNA-binding transcriptional regulator involved in oxidative stress resistance; CP4-6 prophage [Cupriavidus taiwanensis]